MCSSNVNVHLRLDALRLVQDELSSLDPPMNIYEYGVHWQCSSPFFKNPTLSCPWLIHGQRNCGPGELDKGGTVRRLVSSFPLLIRPEVYAFTIGLCISTAFFIW